MPVTLKGASRSALAAQCVPGCRGEAPVQQAATEQQQQQQRVEAGPEEDILEAPIKRRGSSCSVM